MAAKLGFAGRVAVVTGAGGGLGRAYALEFAKRGASVVVNDLGGSFSGDGRGSVLADQVVSEIRMAGGTAVANYDSVEQGEKIIEAALRSYGKIDILVNNAGILRDRSFGNMSEEDWDKIMLVHLKGSFSVTKAAWPHMRKQRYGRIVMTSSPSGLYGNFGQANYAAAKLGLAGLAKTLSLEGKKANIYVNTIAPMANTRMTADMNITGLEPHHVAPVVLFLCHESCQDTGEIIETGGGWACKVKLQRSSPIQLRHFIDDNISVEAVQEQWLNMQFPVGINCPESLMEGAVAIHESISKIPAKPASLKLTSAAVSDLAADERAKAYVFPEGKFQYTEQDIIRYALGIGADLPRDIRYLYEGHAKFAAFPTFSAIIALGDLFKGFLSSVPGLEDVDLSRAIHGEQYLQVLKPIPTNGELRTRSRITDLLDKRKFTQLILDTDVVDASNELVIKAQTVVLFTGSAVGRYGQCKEQVPLGKIPNRPPDAVVEEQTKLNQAALYRLSGDSNPLHIDSDFAAAMGFSQPILHGLCTLGYACRHVLSKYADNSACRFKAIKAQFSKPTIPGQTLVTEMWLDGSRVLFVTKVRETGDVVIKGGYVDLTSVVQAQGVKPESTTGGLKADVVMETVRQRIASMPDIVKQFSGSFRFEVTKDSKVAGEWFIDFSKSPATVFAGPPTSSPDVTLKMEDDVLADLATGKLNPMQAFMQGKLKATGKVMLAQKLGELFKQHAKL